MTQTHRIGFTRQPKISICKLTALAIFCFFLLFTYPPSIISAEITFEGNLNTVSITDKLGTNIAPTAKFTYTQSDGIVTFDASSSTDIDGNITEFRWDFGDGSTGTEATINHQYSAEGVYPVTLTTIDNANAISITQQKVDTFQTKFLFHWDMETIYSAKSGSEDSLTMIATGGAQLSDSGISGKAINLNSGYHANYSPQTMTPDQYISHSSGKITIFGKRLTESGPISLIYCSSLDTVSALVLEVTAAQLVQVTFNGQKVYNFSQGGSLKLSSDLNWHKFELTWEENGHIHLLVDDTLERSHNFTQGISSSFMSIHIGTISGSGYGFLDDITIQQ